MTRRRQDRVLGILMRRGDWVTAATLADQLGVTPRSVRSYVTAVNARVPGGDAIESGPAGYRASAGAAAALRAGAEPDPGTPRERLHAIVRALLDADGGIDVHATADRMHVSSATLEADLGRVRALLSGSDLALERAGSRVRLAGSELAQRRFVSRLAHDEMDDGAFDLDALRRAADTMAIPSEALGAFKTDLVARLGELGFFVNEFAAADVVLHVAIAADRVAQGRALEAVHGEPDATRERIAGALGELTERHFGVGLGQGDRLHLAALVLTRIVVPGSSDDPASPGLDPAIEAAVRGAVSRAAQDYLVDIAHADFVERLALHVQNLVHRAREQAWSRNPLTRTLKSAYPMIFDVAVSIASELSEALGVPIRDDEIAYIAMHVGGRLERSRRAESMLTATIVCPGYYELHELLRSSVDRSLGRSIEVTGVETRVDPDWEAIGTDLVLTTIEPPLGADGRAMSDRIVRIQPFLTDADVERVSAAASRVRRARRLGRLRAELARYFAPGAFVRGLDASRGADGMIRDLGALLIDQGVIDGDYVDSTIERERLSSTAFTDTLAVPHALRMTAERTAIAIGVSEQPVAWGDARVNVVALVAFSESDRPAFQTVFEQFVEVFGEPDSASRIIRRSSDRSSFLDELAAVIDG
ncbi:BglG family transcription antiterminator [Microbacterium marinilacus]|uniref:BglG family transcription antiterminator n=1 Tax=Microbacterium marinilacus TaxID=415209 RepID=A0ABP7BAN6_9MICO|nr:PTS sugar transporter subunit IIA [Microbacterium marinilacus]MBY0687160.1 PRD domain-containing protein [Microbacterium marinilacus]